MNLRQQKFVAEYLKSGNATQAAIKAGYSERTAAEQGVRLLRNVKIEKAVNKAQKKISDKAELDAEDIVLELEEARVMASSLKQPSAMVAASMGKAKLLGLVIDKSQLSGDKSNPVEMMVKWREGEK